MRIISGSRRGAKLAQVEGTDIRPTSDRIREAVFDVLAAHQAPIGGGNVADLFAGTGAMGLEAISRGAAGAWFLDSSPVSLKIIQKNTEICRFADRSVLIRWDLSRGIATPHLLAQPFDLVFLDPPYGLGWVRRILDDIAFRLPLRPGAVIVAEHEDKLSREIMAAYDDSQSCDRPGEENPRAVLWQQKKYGRTAVSYFSLVSSDQ
ncbi:MAG: RsmD family RNA methyltransferase [Deltaproteobacteria bacterium]|nr:RsmD family RNA methyltransferase [Deltaproteobacteria bacterium]